MNEDKGREKSLGSLLGAATGDALGAGFEGMYGEEPCVIEAYAEDREILRYTDDTHMMIGLAESLIEKKGFEGEHMAYTFMQNYRLEPWRGYGPGPPRLFRLMEQGYHWEAVAEMVYRGGSYGNGSAMRVAPVGVLYEGDPVSTRDIAYKTSNITHSHPLGREGAALQALAVSFAMSQDPGDTFSHNDFIANIAKWAVDNIYRKKLHLIAALLSCSEKEIIITQLGNTIEAFNSVPAALYSFLLHPFSYHDAVLYAVSLGGDTDTIGAMTGAISGAFLGIDAIPWQWRVKLENRTYIGELALKLWSLKKGI